MSTPAQRIAAAMGKGINMGSTYECDSQSRDSWRTGRLLRRWRAAGFANVRIPVTWYGKSATGPSKLSDAKFMSQLNWTVDEAIRLGFVVSINAHFEDWLFDAFDDSEAMRGKFWKLWKDIAVAFARIPADKLVLELLNEPHGVFGDYNGGAKPDDPRALALTRTIYKVGRDGVRSASKTRIVAVSTNAMGNVGQLWDVYPTAAQLPGGGDDDRLLMHVHSYDPWMVCGQDGNLSRYSSAPDPYGAFKKDLDAVVAAMKSWRAAVGVPVHLGEYGIGRMKAEERDHDLVRYYYRRLTSLARAEGFPCTVWCDSTNGWFCLTGIKGEGVDEPFGLVKAVLEA